MSQDLEDEILSINSIYGENTLVQIPEETLIYCLTLPSQPSIALRIEFPIDYPNAPPSVLGTQSVGGDVGKGRGTSLVELVRDVLAEVYIPSSPCIFDVMEEIESRMQQFDPDRGEGEEKSTLEEMARPEDTVPNDQPPSHTEDQLNNISDEPSWTLSEVITEKKSVFLARATTVTSVEQSKQYLAHLLATDKKVAKATHNMSAYRIRGVNGVQYQDCDDDGETAAGSRLLHLLELMGVWNGMVVVSRWYGGVHLGPDRFRIINQTARDALVKAGFVQDGGKGGGKKGGK